jgi:hypothetical protein
MCKAAKEQAQDEQRDSIPITWKGQTLQVMRTAAKGYAYRVNTGPDGEDWFFQHVARTDAWGIRVSSGSMGLSIRGYEGQRERILKLLDHFGAVWVDYAVSRVDVCVDMEAPDDFAPDPERMVCRSWRMSQSEHFEVHRQARRVTSITSGKMPGMQVQLYDKRREVIDRQKTWWWDRWAVGRETRVWRVEVRAGKSCLKDDYGVRSFADVEAKIAGIVCDALGKVRYLDSGQSDSNVTRQRVHPLWDLVRDSAATLCEAFGAGGRAEDVIQGYRDELQERWHRLMGGLAAGYATILGLPPFGKPEAIADDLVEGIADWVNRNPRRWRDALQRHKSRFVILERDETVTV